MRPAPSLVGSALLIAAAVYAGCAPPDSRELEVRVRQVAIDPAAHSPVLLLEDPASNVAMPIWIGAVEAQAIAAQLAGDTPPRPMTHDLVKAMLDRVGVNVRRVVIRDLREGTYFADVVLEQDGQELAVDSRPSDAIAIALRCGQPIFVARQLFAREGVVQVRAALGDSVTIAGVTVQDLSAGLAGYFDLPPGQGVVVADVAPGGWDTLQRGDVVLEVDGEPVRDARDFRRKLGRGSGAAALQVQRDGARLAIALARPTTAEE